MTVSRMLTEGVEDVSTGIYELKFMFGLKGTLLQFPAARRGFQHSPCSAVRNLVDVKLLQIEKTTLYCAMFF